MNIALSSSSLLSRRALIAIGGAAAVTALPGCGGGDGGDGSKTPATSQAITMQTFLPSLEGAAAVLRNAAGGSVTTWVNPSSGALTQSLYEEGGRRIRSYFSPTSQQLERVVNETTGEFMAVTTVDENRTDYNHYSASGAWLDGQALVKNADGTYATAKILSSSSIDGQQLKADLTGPVVASVSLLPTGLSGLGPLVPVSTAGILTAQASVSNTLLAVLDRLTTRLIGAAQAQTASGTALLQGLTGSILVVGGILGAASLPFWGSAALVGGGAYLLYRAMINQNAPNLNENREGIDRIFGSAVSDFSSGDGNYDQLSSSLNSYVRGDGSVVRAGLLPLSSMLSTVASTASNVASTLTAAATSAWQQITSGPPAGQTELSGLMVDNSGQTYTASGSYTPSDQSFTFTASGGNKQFTGTGNAATGSGTYTSTQDGTNQNGTLTASREALGQCQTQQSSGGQGAFTKSYDLGRDSGSFELSYEMYGIPDKLEVINAGKVVFTTSGLVSGGTTVQVPFSGSRIVFVVVSAPNSGTAWDYSIGCPA